LEFSALAAFPALSAFSAFSAFLKGAAEGIERRPFRALLTQKTRRQRNAVL
jgi:hypothetical protein